MPDSTWADGKVTELDEQLGKMSGTSCLTQDVPLIFVVFSTYASCGERNLNPIWKTFSSDKFGKRFHDTKRKTEKVGIDGL